MLPGGTGEHGETVEQTLCRELSEELGADCRVGRLLWTVEHFFDLGVRRWHQLLWIYDVSVPDDSAVARADTLDTTGPGGSDHFRWFAKNDLTALRVLPGFVPSALGALPSEPRFLVHRDDLR
jgi:8-oxo-dGTP pyrophosphatase MutT (NUDIX family)